MARYDEILSVYWNFSSLCWHLLLIFSLRRKSHGTVIQGVVKIVRVVEADHLFLFYISFLYYYLTLLTLARICIGFVWCIYEVVGRRSTQLPTFSRLPCRDLSNTFVKVTATGGYSLCTKCSHRVYGGRGGRGGATCPFAYVILETRLINGYWFKCKLA
jgi:hypothetical protein